MRIAEFIVAAVKLYSVAGGAVAVAFLLYGIDRVDPGARNAYAFRPLLVPGIVFLWPIVIWRWAALERERK